METGFAHSLGKAALVAAIMFAQPSHAQEDWRQVGSVAHLPALAGDYFALDSREVGRTYHIFVRLPEGYDAKPDARYPVVYMLDGDSTFPMLAPMHLLMHYDDKLPEAILVGIAYGSFDPSINKRHIDYRLKMDDGTPGGSPQFLDMLEKELVPRIEAKFRTDPDRRVLVGQSRGGSAVLQAAWRKPGLFWGHLASNPGREFETRLLYGMDLPPPDKPRNGYLILASGSADWDYLRGTAIEWRDAIAARDDLPWDTRFVNVPGGTHAADLGNAYRAAMRIMFGTPE
ncbi:hypothetical protein GCM10011371_10970 [Novosphingobium marinum]|uniref:Esterase n=1 Tax=Novosphingobium marinum TaxID=1514948 RepID=A0A7Y9XY72_9SPHN|nr:alpha/beta hydrolase-fold protein [Novosphingobium marinum]NYH95206.1 hypothetical protein [Novosphingobium marinum]GGC25138.1 hypothetical protein GCM10011371_10970 [Novosphingobium marinum]